MFFKWKRIEWECGLKRGDSCGGKVCVFRRVIDKQLIIKQYRTYL